MEDLKLNWALDLGLDPDEPKFAKFIENRMLGRVVEDLPAFSRNINLRHLITTKQIEVMPLTAYHTYEEVSALKAKYLDDSWVKHQITRDTVGYAPDGSVAFVYFKDIVRVPLPEVCQAMYGLTHMKWYDTKESHRACLQQSGGDELQFGWNEKAAGGPAPYRPTELQIDEYEEMWPILNRMNGIFARCLPRTWAESNLAIQQKTGWKYPAEGKPGKGKQFSMTFNSATFLHNAPTSIHLDSKNAQAGMTVLTTAGEYEGGEFIFPQYGACIPIQIRDVLIAATHREFHCNFKDVVGDRYSIIAYSREGLLGDDAQEPKKP